MSLLTPVRYPAMRYSHTDAGAPVLTAADGVIKTILKACLITGYGTKASAGWTSLFEDENRIVLRLPEAAQVLGFPDIKIENGAGKYRVVSQSNPTGLDDTVELASTPLLTKGENPAKLQPKWELIATDVGFVFWYGADEGSFQTSSDPGCFLGCFFNNSLLASAIPTPVVFHPSVGISQTTGSWSGTWMELPRCRNLIDNSLLPVVSFIKAAINDTSLNLYQNGLSGTTLVSSILYSMTNALRSASREVVSGADQEYLRACFVSGYAAQEYFIPIEYWEL